MYVPTVETFERDGRWFGVIIRRTGGRTEWEINEDAARMISIAKREGYERAKDELRGWMAPQGGPK